MKEYYIFFKITSKKENIFSTNKNYLEYLKKLDKLWKITISLKNSMNTNDFTTKLQEITSILKDDVLVEKLPKLNKYIDNLEKSEYEKPKLKKKQRLDIFANDIISDQIGYLSFLFSKIKKSPPNYSDEWAKLFDSNQCNLV